MTLQISHHNLHAAVCAIGCNPTGGYCSNPGECR